MTVDTPRLTFNRAATAVVRSRVHLQRAEEELCLALRILTEGTADRSVLDPAERLVAMQHLERYVSRLRELQEMSRAAWGGGRSWWVRDSARTEDGSQAV